jgi:hypothetical protein
MRSDRFRAAAEDKDFSAVDDLFAEDVTFRSPVVFKPYEGREAVMVVLSAVTRVLEDFTYLDEFEGAGGEVLLFGARVGERELNGIDLLRFDDADLVRELTVMIRPLSGLTALADAMRARLEAANA